MNDSIMMEVKEQLGGVNIRPSIREEILRKANEIAKGNRAGMYGQPERNFQTIAIFWSEYLGAEITPSDVGIMMALMKIARISSGHYKEDNYVDVVNYLLFAAELNEAAASENV